jgi:hypothetical protein
MDDDDIQDYEASGWRKRQIEKDFADIAATNNLKRNFAIEEVAQEIEKMKAFGPDTISSFAVYIRGMKR